MNDVFQTDMLGAALNLWREGDPDGVSKIYELTFGRIREIVRMRMGSEIRVVAESSDVVQEVFCSILSQAPPKEIRTGQQLLAYLIMAVMNRLKDLQRYHMRQKRDRRRQHSLEGMNSEAASFPQPQPTPSQISMGREEYARYLKAVAGLSTREREAVIMVRHLGISTEQAAEELNLGSPAAFRTLLSRALAKVSLRMQGRENQNYAD